MMFVHMRQRLHWYFCRTCEHITLVCVGGDSLQVGRQHTATSALISVMVVLPYSSLRSLMVGQGDSHLAHVDGSQCQPMKRPSEED